jgi:hypothetical protein
LTIKPPENPPLKIRAGWANITRKLGWFWNPEFYTSPVPGLFPVNATSFPGLKSAGERRMVTAKPLAVECLWR